MKKFIAMFLAVTLILFSVLPVFARGFGGGRSSSSSFSRSSGFTSTRSHSSSYSRGFSSSTPTASFTKSTPSVSKPAFTTTKTVSNPISTPTPKSVKVVKVTKVVRTSPTVVNNYGGSSSDLLTSMLILHTLTSSNNHSGSINVTREQLNGIKNQMLRCYDQGGGRSCITSYL